MCLSILQLVIVHSRQAQLLEVNQDWPVFLLLLVHLYFPCSYAVASCIFDLSVPVIDYKDLQCHKRSAFLFFQQLREKVAIIFDIMTS